MQALLPWVSSTFFFAGIIVGALGLWYLVSGAGNGGDPPTAA